MPETIARTTALAAQWQAGRTIVNLRGRPDDPAFTSACADALGMPLPTEPCRTAVSAKEGALRIVWAGPDDWFVLGAADPACAPADRLRQALAGVHAAVTDVSSGYAVLRLAGPAARDVLAQGCPLDLHPRAFGPGQCAGSHFFKASVWLWLAGPEPLAFELLVRRSFRGYLDLMLARAARGLAPPGGAALSAR